MEKRMTRVKDKYDCRIAGGCPIEDWIIECIDGELIHNPCDNCPVMPIVNRLAEYEDKEEELEKLYESYPETSCFPNLYKLVYGGKEE